VALFARCAALSDDLPARLRRLERLGDAAAAEQEERPERPGRTDTAN
jgi:hypothetical protein